MNTVTQQGVFDKVKSATYTLLPIGRTTICQLTMENGFTIEGQSACVDAANYNQHLGEKYAYEDALNNVWPFEGYLLAERLYQASKGSAMSNSTFGSAIRALKDGKRISRAGWNGKGMFVYLVPAASYPPTTEIAKAHYGGANVPYNAYLAIKNVDNTISTWVPSVNDVLAEDWSVV